MANYSTDIEEIKDYYADLLILQYHSKYKAKETVKTGVDIYSGDGLLLQLQDTLNIDEAVGVQLDLIGKILNCPREIPIQQEVDYFSFEKDNAIGFSTPGNVQKGYFKSLSYDYSTIYSLDDSNYRQLLKFKARANRQNASWQEIDDLLWDIFYLGEYFDISKFITVGSPTITDDGVVSGLSDNNYLTINNNNIGELLHNASSWEIEYSFIYGTSQDLSAILYSNVPSIRLFFVPTDDTKQISLNLSSDGVNDNISLNIDNPLVIGNSYKHKIIFTGNKYISILYNKDGVTLQTKSISSSLKIYKATSFNIGSKNTTESLFDLSKFSITVDGIKVFSGSTKKSAVTLTNNKDMSITYTINKESDVTNACQILGYFQAPIGIKCNILISNS